MRVGGRLAGASLAAGLVACVLPLTAGAATPPAPGMGRPRFEPTSMVNTFAGTGTGGTNPGSIGEFPGADVPFGMLQWSPDTTPDRISGGGYSYADSQISGFSLTHLSGDGCAVYGDVPILPTVGPIGADPAAASDPFTHTAEHAAPGQYQVTLGPSGIDTQLAVTTRTGIALFTFPSTSQGNVLFKASDSAAGAVAAQVQTHGNKEVTGQVTSGGFCGTGTNYTLYYVAQFDRPFTSSGIWSGTTVTPGATSCAGKTCGLDVTFDTATTPAVMMKVGISFVSTADARANLAAEDPEWSLPKVETQATAKWNALLDHIAIGGGTAEQQRIFYTALYHSLLHPNVVSDVNGKYAGEDGHIHQAANGRAQYANFSEWDTYRSEIELESLVAPEQTGDMVQSLVNDADQDGWLPKWAIVGGDAAQMNGDSADPLIASAYAFGVRNFNVKQALAAMVKGADRTEPNQGLEIERQYLSQYLSQHYVNAGSLDLDSIDYSDGASSTLEFALDDFSIAQVAQSLGDRTLYTSMMQRAHNWEYLFNPTTGYLEAKTNDGSFPPGPAFNPSLFEDGGQQGFEEGNGIQYTWSVPQDLAGLAGLMGGDQVAVADLDTFFGQLNAGRFAPNDWAGNEPNLWTPWEYDYFGAPAKTQATVRQIVDTLYHDAPVNEPGNDDLGALSSWYVWAALGLYPVTPGTANLALASPLFPSASITLPDGKHLVLRAPDASASTPYITALHVSGTTLSAPLARSTCNGTMDGTAGGGWNRPWLPASILRRGGTVTYSLAAVPKTGWGIVPWGTAPGDSPPSYATGRIDTIGFSRPSGGVTVKVGVPTTVQFGVAQLPDARPAQYRVTTGAGITALSPTSGEFGSMSSGDACSAGAKPFESFTFTAANPGTSTVTVTFQPAGPPLVIDVDATA